MIEFTKKVKKSPLILSNIQVKNTLSIMPKKMALVRLENHPFIVEIRISNSKIHKQNEDQNSNLLFHQLKYEIKS